MPYLHRMTQAAAVFLVGCLALLTPMPAGSAVLGKPLRLGVLKFGTVSWELDVIGRLGLIDTADPNIVRVELASTESEKVALLSKSVDVVVSDWIWVARERAQGRKLTFVPFSASLGALMVKADGKIASLADLKGKRIGVAGGPLDKSWLMLQAVARKTAGLDLTKAAEPVFGAPPLLAEKLASGELDAALVFWNFAAKLEAKGFKPLVSGAKLEAQLGASGPVAMLGYVFDEETAEGNPGGLKSFLSASAQAKELLLSSDAEWVTLKLLMRAENEAEFLKLRDRFRDGIPKRSVTDEEKDAAALFKVLAAEGGEQLVGQARELPPGTFYRPRP